LPVKLAGTSVILKSAVDDADGDGDENESVYKKKFPIRITG
jgi:hypothetical protein